jgi:hypothetical protein
MARSAGRGGPGLAGHLYWPASRFERGPPSATIAPERGL